MKTGLGSGSTGYKFSWRNDDGSHRISQIELDRNGNVYFKGGNVGIGTSNPYGYKLYVNGVTASYGWYTLSDEKWKKNIKHLDGTLEKLSSIEGVSYDWDTETYPEKQFSKKKQIGFIAQDVEAIYPEVVHTDDEGNKAIEYGKLTAVLVEAVKELKAENDYLSEQNSMLEERLLEIETTLAELASKHGAK